MAELELKDLVKIYPFTQPKGLVGRKKAMEALQREKQQPYTTNEGVIAVQKFSLQAEHGEFVVLLGPSGCGKTTLLRMIAGLEDVTAGDILLDGRSIVNDRPEDRDIAMVFQNFALYPHLTVYDNLAFTLRNQHVPRAELDQMVRLTAQLLELEDLLERLPRELSGGQQQRVAIGRAIIRRPKLFLMDEPFSNLDAVLRRQLRVVVKRLHKELDTTFFYVTHDQSEAMAMGTKIVVLQSGMIRQVGTPEEIYRRPESLYVATFVGAPQMNVERSARLERSRDGWTIAAWGANWAVKGDFSPELDGRNVILGVRPVHLELTRQGVEAEVSYAEPMGSETHLHLRLGNESLTAVVPPEQAAGLLRGQRVHLAIRPGRCHLFEPQTERRL